MILITGTTILATKMISAIPHMPFFTSEATPEKIVSSKR
ncbi:Uncharacterised protein [Vibrio cholerae]|nr:Uncharacterised protein [Vibrio cholerae]